MTQVCNGDSTVLGTPLIAATTTLQKAESGADTNVFTFTPPASTGMLKLTFSGMSFTADVTAAIERLQ